MPYINPSVVAQVKQIDLLTYLKVREPDELVKIGPNAYATKTHDSLKISNGKWYWWSRGFGGRSALDYLIKVCGMSFTDAVICLADRCHALTPATQPIEKTPKPKRLALPPKNADASVAASYLESRGIARSVIDHCIEAGIVYESRRGSLVNVVFVGCDEHDVPRYAAIRGCKGKFKGEAEGSDKRYSFRRANYPLNPEAHVFEGAIDALSYASILEMQGKDWKRENLISLGGVPPVSAHPGKDSIPVALVQHLEDNPNAKVLRLHLDNDAAGLNAAALISALLSSKYEVHIEPPSEGKDVNDQLVALVGRAAPEAKGRAR